MRNRFFVSDAAGTEVELSGDELHHAVRVARCRVGEEVEVFDSSGRQWVARVASLERNRAVLELLREEPGRESPFPIVLAMALIQPEKLELVFQKAVELGVQRIIPMVTRRMEIRPDRVAGKRERWEKIALEAAKQSGRSRVPVIETPAPFADVLGGSACKLLFDADSEPSPFPEKPGSATILIGPEGGWAGEEIAAARSAAAIFCRLGPRRLRAETAAIAAVALVAARWGDLR